MDYGKLELKLCKIVEKRLGEGWIVAAHIPAVSSNWGVCCLLGAAAVEDGKITDYDYHQRSARILGISEDEAVSVEAGFMGWTSYRGTEADPDLYDIGERIVRDYAEVE